MRTPQSDRQERAVAHRQLPHANLCVLLVLVSVCYCLEAPAQHVGCYSKTLTEGEPAAVAIRGSLLYLGAGSNLIVQNLDSLGIPRVISRVDLCSVILDIAVQGSRAFVLCKSGALSVVDVSSVYSPRERFRIEIPGAVTSLAAAGDRIAVASDDLVIVRCDSSAWSLTITDGYPVRASRVTMDNWYVLAASPDSGLMIFGWVQGHLQRAGRLTDPAATDVVLMDTLALVSYSDFPRLSVVGFSRPDFPSVLDAAILAASPQDLSLDRQDSLICVIGPSMGIATVRILPTGQATVLGMNILQGKQPRAVGFGVGKAYIPCGSQGLRIVNVTDPANPSLTGYKYDEANDPRRVAFGIDTCFVADGRMGLVRLSVSDPRYPEIVESVRAPQGGFTNSVSLNGSLARTAESAAKLRVLSTRVPFQTYYQSDSTGLRFNDLAVDGPFLYVADGTLGLRILDAADTTGYDPVGIAPVPGLGALDIGKSGNRSYLASPSSGVSIVDISTPEQPSLIFTYACFAHAVDITDSVLYVAAGSAGLITLNVSGQYPVLLSEYPTPAPAVDVHLYGHYAYVACGEAGLLILDMAQPSNPQLVGSFDTDGYARFVTVSGDIASVSDSAYGPAGGGLYFLDVSYFTHIDPTCLILAANPSISNMRDFSVSINPTANLAYRILASPTHFGAGNVIYINPQRWQDLDGDGLDDGIVDQDHMTIDSIRAEFMKLRADPDPTRCPVIYLIGNGSPNHFQISADEVIPADTLLAWIDQIPVSPAGKLAVIIESCYSGSFIDELSATHRVIITSTNATQAAQFEGTQMFSTYLWGAINECMDLSNAFMDAYDFPRPSEVVQTPQFEANGDGIPNQPWDYASGNGYNVIPVSHLETLPGIIDPPEGHMDVLTSPACTLRCVIDALEGIQRVWFRIFPTGYSGDPPVLQLPSGDMHSTGAPDSFETVYVDANGFFEFAEDYFPAIYAIDNAGRRLLPLVIHIQSFHQTLAGDRELPAQFELSNNYPNPFNSVTRFRLNLHVPGHVRFAVFNILGQQVDVLLDGHMLSGEHMVTWDGTNAGTSVSSGVYIARLEFGDDVKSVKMVLLR